MPQFAPGESRTAVVTLPVKPAGLPCTIEVWLALNGDRAATSGEVPFASTGVEQSITLPDITMPDAGGTYPVYIDVLIAGILDGWRAAEDVVIAPVAPPFTGFSLLLANCPPGTAYWLADFPYRGYPGKISMRPIGEAGWITADAPGTDTIRIILLDASYQCIDPLCERYYALFFENGRHYLLDCATGELGTNPNPPPFPPEETPEPALISINIPAVASGADFQVDATLFLPILRGDNQGWGFFLNLNRIRLYEALGARFLSPALKAVSGGVGQMFMSLDRPDAMYFVQMKSSARYWPTRWTVENLPPGSYPP